jgi:hypothetical protein
MANNTPGFQYSDDPSSPASDLNAENLTALVSKALIRNIASNAVTSVHVAQSVAGAGLGGGGGNPLNVKTDNLSLEVANDQIRIKEEGVTTAHIADGAITQEKLNEALSEIITNIQEGIYNTLYKVGDYFITENTANPSERFGGEWVLVEGRFLIGAGEVDDEHNFEVGTTGGEYEHTLSAAEFPKHFHYIASTVYGPGGQGLTANNYLTHAGAGLANESQFWLTGAAEKPTAGRTSMSGGDDEEEVEPHNNIPPYRAVFMWRKISDTTPEN